MFTKRDLKNFLEQISTEAKLLKLEFVSTEKFRVELKCKVEKDATPEFYSQFAGEWIKKFSKFTATTWIVRNCFPRLKRLLYRKVFACHRSAFNKKKKPDFETRNQECKAKIEFKMKFINRNTIKNDPLLKEGLNLTISIDFTHTHKVRAPEAFNLLKSTSETDSKFQEYFNTGCVGVAAKYYHELTLIDKYGENCTEILSNANINPSLRHVLYLYGKRKKETVDNPNFGNIMDNKKECLENIGFTLSFTETPETIVTITPVMKRVITEIGLEHVLIDSTQTPNGPIVTFYYVPSKIGALPVACVIHSEPNKTDYFQAFYSVKLVLEMEFNRNFEPTTLMLNHLEEQRSITSLYPKTKLMSSRYAMCSEAWRWLNDDENKIERKKRHNIMALIKAVVYADSSESAEKAHLELNENDYMNSTSKIKEYIDNLWQAREEWQVFGEDVYSNNLVEASIRFVKEFVIRRCKSFNKCIMVDVVANILENQYRRILFSHSKVDKTRIYTKFLSKANIVLGFGSDVRRISPSEFRIECQPRPKKYVYFRTDTMCCDCVSGKRGQFCEHLCAIINITDTEMMKMPTLTEDDKSLFIKLAGGPDGDVEEFDAIKPESQDKNLEEYTDDKEEVDKQDYSDIQIQDLEEPSAGSTPKSLTDDYFYLEVKTERCDPLENDTDNEESTHDIEYPVTQSLPNDAPATSKHCTDVKRTYETALKAVNDEFRRLNRLFSENPNSANLGTLARLARELSKIRPVESINLSNMEIKLNNTRKRKHRQ